MQTHDEALENILASYFVGRVEVIQSKIVGNVAMVAAIEANTNKELNNYLKEQGFLKHLLEVSTNEVMSYNLFLEEMILVYASTIFDSYLYDVSKFIFLQTPNQFLKTKNVSISKLFNGDINEIKNTACEDLALEQSRFGFLNRISFLEQKSGFRFGITDELFASLREASDIRNAIVHSRTESEVSLDKNGILTSNFKRKKFIKKDIIEYVNTFDGIIIKIHPVVREKILLDELSEKEKNMIGLLRESPQFSEKNWLKEKIRSIL